MWLRSWERVVELQQEVLETKKLEQWERAGFLRVKP